ncbi:MAG: isoleucine--tRNA ligase [Bacteroidetes bacterium]|nr:MAG: isoleucine--tRNA ligase [Bacteroidota bacterium]
MSSKYRTYPKLNLSEIGKEVLEQWEGTDVFQQSLDNREGNKPFVFFEGPPSANGTPGIHHVMARTIKDIFCRYKTLDGYRVDRKAGWDTHGLPVEIGVEKTLGITKEDIGKKISVEEYNKACRTEVMKYKDMWDDLTVKMGYWVDMDHPYITFDNKYIESVWWLLKQLYNKNLMYKGYTIQPYSPAAGTGLSTHELNQPGCYKDVKDTTAIAQFKVIRNDKSENLFNNIDTDLFILAWTTTPWTLPSNTALAVGPKISYVKVRTFNQYTGIPITVILAKDRLASYFLEKNRELAMEDYKLGDKNIPFQILEEFVGKDLYDVSYEQLMPFVKPMGDAFKVIPGDFVTTEDGTGVVHIAPTFGADDDRVAKAAGIVPLVLIDIEGTRCPMVDLQGRFYHIDKLDKQFIADYVNTDYYAPYAGRYVKNAYDVNLDDKAATLDIDLAVMLKKENRAFKVEKHTHNYPHCWRTDKPILYYPLDSWFVKTTDYKKRMIDLNNTINWKPKSTGEGRFGNWLENLVDWNLSRSRFWGVPLPIWVSEDRKEQVCIGSAEELKAEIEKSMAAGFMTDNPLANFVPGDMSKENYETFDFHKPYADNIFLVSDSGQKMFREPDLIDVWFDSGAMPYAQFHYPFENKDKFMDGKFPADFIAEGVDQTRGWFFTLHAIATMVFDKVAYKNVISNGLVLDKKGNKMSKRLGNGVDPFSTLEKYGPDATRWYMITNAQPWDNLKFDLAGITEVQRKFFGTLYNTYSFFALYANIDGFTYSEDEIPFHERPEIDRWILSELNSLILKTQDAFENYEPTRAGRGIQSFVDEHLSNWYVRLSRRRFWKGDYTSDKISAYQTLYKCLTTVAQLASPIAPFFMDRLYQDLNSISNKDQAQSIHLTDLYQADESQIDKKLEERMQMAQTLSSMVLSLRKQSKNRVRQPLNKVMIPVKNTEMREQLDLIRDLILAETNVKQMEFITEDADILVKKIKPNFKTLGPKYGKLMKQIVVAVNKFSAADIQAIDSNGTYDIDIDGNKVQLSIEDVEITTQDIPGWAVSTSGKLTVALDLTLTEELIMEGMARELVNRIQNLRKDSDFDVVDKIHVKFKGNLSMKESVEQNFDYICSETLAESFEMVDHFDGDVVIIDITSDNQVSIQIDKV